MKTALENEANGLENKIKEFKQQIEALIKLAGRGITIGPANEKSLHVGSVGRIFLSPNFAPNDLAILMAAADICKLREELTRAGQRANKEYADLFTFADQFNFASVLNNLGVYHYFHKIRADHETVVLNYFIKARALNSYFARNNLAVLLLFGCNTLQRNDFAAKEEFQGLVNSYPNCHLFQFNNAVMLFHGLGIPSNQVEAIQTILKIATEGYEPAQAFLGNYYLSFKEEKEKSEAIKWLELSSQQENSFSQFVLAERYLKAESTRAEGFKWLKSAADLRHIEAQYKTYLCYRNGTGTPKDEKLASEYLKHATERNFPPALYKMGIRYITINPTLAHSYLERASKSGINEAYIGLGDLNNGHYNYPANLKLAEDYYKKAAEAKLKEGEFQYAIMLAKTPGMHNKQVLDLLQRSVAQGWAPAQYQLAMSLKYNDTKNYRDLLERSAAQNFSEALFELGMCCYFGLNGMAIDKKKGSELLLKLPMSQHFSGLFTEELNQRTLQSETEVVQTVVKFLMDGTGGNIEYNSINYLVSYPINRRNTSYFNFWSIWLLPILLPYTNIYRIRLGNQGGVDPVIVSRVLDAIAHLANRIFASRVHPSLETLVLKNQNIPTIGIEPLANALSRGIPTTTLSIFDVFHNIPASFEALTQALRTHRTLTSLNLSNMKINEQGAQYFSQWLESDASDQLERLALIQFTGPPNAFVVVMNALSEHTLYSLVLQRTPLALDVVNALFHVLRSLPRLKKLDLSNCKLSRESQYLIMSSLANHPTLAGLSLSKNEFVERDLFQFFFAKTMKLLEELHLSGCALNNLPSLHPCKNLKIFSTEHRSDLQMQDLNNLENFLNNTTLNSIMVNNGLSAANAKIILGGVFAYQNKNVTELSIIAGGKNQIEQEWNTIVRDCIKNNKKIYERNVLDWSRLAFGRAFLRANSLRPDNICFKSLSELKDIDAKLKFSSDDVKRLSKTIDDYLARSSVISGAKKSLASLPQPLLMSSRTPATPMSLTRSASTDISGAAASATAATTASTTNGTTPISVDHEIDITTTTNTTTMTSTTPVTRKRPRGDAA